MPGPELGLSFAPTPQNAQQNAQQSQTPIQDAIKVLSLRIPRFVGAQGMAPGALLNSPGAGGVPGAGGMGGLDELLKRLFGGGGAFPIPNVTPGGEDRMVAPNEPPDSLIGGVKAPGSFQPNGSGQRPSFGGGFRMPQKPLV